MNNDLRESTGTLLLSLIGIVAILAWFFWPSVSVRLSPLWQWWQSHRLYVFGGVILFVLVLLAIIAIRIWQRQRESRARLDAIANGPTLYLLPRADWKRIEPEDVQVWARLADSLPRDEHISFEVAGNEIEIAFFLHGSSEGVRAALTQFLAEWPGLFRKPAQPDPLVPPEGWSIWWMEILPTSYEQAVRAVSDDPLRAVLVELNSSVEQSRGAIQIIVSRNYGIKRQLGNKAFAARDEQTASRGVRALRSQEARELESRARATYLNVTLRAIGMANTQDRAQGIARGLARAITASFDDNNPVRIVRQGSQSAPVVRREPGRMAPWSADDLAWLAHLVGNDLTQLAPRIATAPARYLPADPEMRFDEARYHVALLEE